MTKLFLLLLGIFISSCATSREGCQPDDKTAYCESLRRGTPPPAAPEPAIPKQIYPSRAADPDAIENNPHYKPEVP